MSVKDASDSSLVSKFDLHFEYDRSWREARNHTKQRIMPDDNKSSK